MDISEFSIQRQKQKTGRGRKGLIRILLFCFVSFYPPNVFHPPRAAVLLLWKAPGTLMALMAWLVLVVLAAVGAVCPLSCFGCSSCKVSGSRSWASNGFVWCQWAGVSTTVKAFSFPCYSKQTQHWLKTHRVNDRCASF